MKIEDFLKPEYIFPALSVACIIVMLINSKINITSIFVAQIKVFKNNKTKKTSVLDVFSFIFCPIALSLVICLWYGFVINEDLAQILTTAFSLIFTLLFAFQAILVGKKNSSNNVENDVINQTFVSIVTSSIFSLTMIILSIMVMFFSNIIITRVLTTIILALSFMTILLLLMIIKRTFKVFMHDDKNDSK